MSQRRWFRRSSIADRQQLTIGDYVLGKNRDSPYGPAPIRYGLANARREIAWRLAKRKGWAVRSDQRGFTKVFDPRTGNVCFAPDVARAVWGLFDTLKHCEEVNHALIRMMIERAP